MSTIFEAKQRQQIDAPVLLFVCTLADGRKFYWSTERVTVAGHEYDPRILRHNAQDIKLGAEDSVDAVSRLSVTLSNVDGLISSIETTYGWKGAKLEVRLGFFDVVSGTLNTDLMMVFKGRSNAPESMTESAARLTFTNRLSLSRVLLPEIRIQKRCPWRFPANATERQQAALVTEAGQLTVLQRCGYSADQPGGVGSLNGGAPFTSCDYNAWSCQQRGMYDKDASGRPTKRFGGLQFLPPVIQVRSNNERGSHLSPVIENEAKYNDFVPMIYGTSWIVPPIVLGRNDGNLTRLEILLGVGPIVGVRQVLVNGVDIPQGVTGAKMTATGWWNSVSDGGRAGGFNLDFTNAQGKPIGDPHGSLATVSVVVPNRVADGTSTPKVEILVDGLELSTFDSAGGYVSEVFTSNPAWVLLDLLRRSGWQLGEINLASFLAAAAWCDETVQGVGLDGRAISGPRARCNFVVQKRRSAAELVRGVRLASGLMLGYDTAGLIEARIETALVDQHPAKLASSNAPTALNGGWPAYEFGDGVDGLTDIEVRPDGSSTMQLSSRGSGEVANRWALDFINTADAYQQDGASLVDFDDVERTGQEVSATLPAIGVSDLGQALRTLRRQLKKAVEGNRLISFSTGARGIGLRPGDLIAVTYARFGLNRETFRVTSLSPSENYRGFDVVAQLHRDTWYDENVNDWNGARLVQPGVQASLPRPLAGLLTISERATGATELLGIEVAFEVPSAPSALFMGVPGISLTAQVSTQVGGLPAGTRLYYAISAVNGDGSEGTLSPLVRVALPTAGAGFAVTLTNISAPGGAAKIRIYRGLDALQVARIGEVDASVTQFIDDGSQVATAGAPDENFDHAVGYWRWQKYPETQASVVTANSIGAAGLGLVVDGHRGDAVRISRGKGSGQERIVVSNTANVLTVDRPWDVLPDGTSRFTIAESTWRPAGEGKASPLRWEVPWRGGATLEATLRSANAQGREAEATASPIVSHQLSPSAGGGTGDQDVPPAPSFAVSVRGDGTVEVGAIGFVSLVNTTSISDGLLRFYFVDETALPTGIFLSGDLTPSSTQLLVANDPTWAVDSFVQVGTEIVRIDHRVSAGQYSISRGELGTEAAAWAVNEKVYTLDEKSFSFAFSPGLFGGEGGGNWADTVALPQVRVAAGQLRMTNRLGTSGWFTQAFTLTTDRGLRTLNGGQIVLQIPGYQAIQVDAVPRVILDRDVVVRDVYARVGEAPRGTALQVQVLTDASVYADLVIAAGATTSNVVSGFDRAVLPAGTALGLSIVGIGQYVAGNPGRDLMVTLRS